MASDDLECSSPQSVHKPHLFVALSEYVVTGVQSSTTLRLRGNISGHDIMILVDSGSTHTFLSESVAPLLPDVTRVRRSIIYVTTAPPSMHAARRHWPAYIVFIRRVSLFKFV